jgi:hypothetical protein
VVPVHDEEREIAGFLESAIRGIPEVPVTLVFDRCADRSVEVGLEVCRRHPEHRIFPYVLEKNPYGKAGACLAGLWALLQMGAPAELPVLLWDSDNEYLLQPALVRRLFAWVAETEGLASAKRQGPRLRRSTAAQWVVRSCLRAFHRRPVPEDVLTAVHALPLGTMLMAMNGARAFDMETRLVVYGLRHGLPIVEDVVPYFPRTEGKKIRSWHLFRILLAATGWV